MNDGQDKRTLSCWLQETFHTEVWDSDTVNQYAHFDLSCQINGKRVAIELKARKVPSTTGYLSADNSCETFKQECLTKLVNDGIFDKALLISTYSDGKLRISNVMTARYTIETKNCPSQTYFGNSSRRPKRLTHFVQYVEKNFK